MEDICCKDAGLPKHNHHYKEHYRCIHNSGTSLPVLTSSKFLDQFLDFRMMVSGIDFD